ncbi:MAG TPA: response regulator, partial [Usitatibacter sp.]|nr:response regulator [Usitatibacter sp.]
MARILLVDDSEENRAALESLLAAEGHVLDTIGESRLALARARDSPPDLVIVDLLLPGVPSWSLIRDLRRDPGLIGIPVLGLSPEGMGGARQ